MEGSHNYDNCSTLFDPLLTLLRITMNKSLLMATLVAAVALAACGKKPEEAAAGAADAASAVVMPAVDTAASAASDAAAAASDAASMSSTGCGRTRPGPSRRSRSAAASAFACSAALFSSSVLALATATAAAASAAFLARSVSPRISMRKRLGIVGLGLPHFMRVLARVSVSTPFSSLAPNLISKNTPALNLSIQPGSSVETRMVRAEPRQDPPPLPHPHVEAPSDE